MGASGALGHPSLSELGRYRSLLHPEGEEGSQHRE